MEEYYSLIEIVRNLLESGYEIDFASLGETPKQLKRANNAELLPGDFKIDKIYKCKGNIYDSYITYVFAMSSKRYKFKGILINGLEQRTDLSLWDKWGAFINIFKTVPIWRSLIKKQLHE